MNKQRKTLPSKHSSWWRRLEDVFHLRLQKTSWRSLQDVLIKTNIFTLVIRLQKASWSRPIYSSWPYVFKTSSRRFQDVFKTYSRRLAITSSRHFEDVFKKSCKNVFKTSSRRLKDVLKTSWIKRKKENTCVGDTFLKSCNPEDSVKKRLQHRCFPVKFAKYLRTPILTEQLQWLLLNF